MRTIELHGKETTLDNLVSLIKENLEETLQGSYSRYINITVGEGIGDDYFESVFTIRMSNHSAKSKNNKNKTISFINDSCNQGYYGMYFDEYIVSDLDNMNTNETNHKGWVSVSDRLEDFINDLKLSI